MGTYISSSHLDRRPVILFSQRGINSRNQHLILELVPAGGYLHTRDHLGGFVFPHAFEARQRRRGRHGRTFAEAS
jgi:hypothetical protein